MVNDDYPVFKWLFHWEYTQHFQTNPHCYSMGEIPSFVGNNMAIFNCYVSSPEGKPLLYMVKSPWWDPHGSRWGWPHVMPSTVQETQRSWVKPHQAKSYQVAMVMTWGWFMNFLCESHIIYIYMYILYIYMYILYIYIYLPVKLLQKTNIYNHLITPQKVYSYIKPLLYCVIIMFFLIGKSQWWPCEPGRRATGH